MGDPQAGAQKRAHFISVRQQTSILTTLSKMNDFASRTGGSHNRM